MQSGLTKPSVISQRVGNVRPNFITTILLKLIPQIPNELAEGSIISVSEKKFRIRKLFFSKNN